MATQSKFERETKKCPAATASHIAVILHDFSAGGSERIAIRLANEWARRGRQVTLLCGTEEGAVRPLVAAGVAIQACSPITPRGLWSRIQLGWRLAKLVRSYQPDIVFAPGNFHMIVLAILGRMPFARRPAFVCKISNPMDQGGIGAALKPVLAAIIRYTITPIDALVAMSASLRAEAKPYTGATPVEQIEEPILGDREIPLAKRDEKTDAPLIVCVGRLEPQKDFLTAVRAFGKLNPGLGARLVIVGEGAQRARLEAEIAKLRLSDRVTLAGYVSNARVFLDQADLLLMTSRFEGYPAVLIEALAAGLAIVSTRCSPAIDEILFSPELGSVTQSREPAAIADAIEAQLAKPRPRPETSTELIARHRLGPCATAYLQLFDRLAA